MGDDADFYFEQFLDRRPHFGSDAIGDEDADHPPCPYCGAPTFIRSSLAVYKVNYGNLLMCSGYPLCDAYVGCHEGTETPKGTLAKADLRAWRRDAHCAFDRRWYGRGRSRRGDAYLWLSHRTGKSLDACHIGEFTIAECQEVIRLCGQDDLTRAAKLFR